MSGTPSRRNAAAARLLPSVLYIALAVALWQALILLFHVKEFVVPSPAAVFRSLFSGEKVAEATWWDHISTTFSEIIVSFLFTALVGIGLAIAITWSRFLRAVLMPVIAVFNSLPKIALAPLFLIWLGYGFKANVTIAIICAFFPVVLNTTVGLDSVEEDLLDLVRYLNASKAQVFLKIRIPNSLPFIFSGLKVSATMTVVGVIVGEFVASSRGLGFLIKDSQAMMNTPPMFASLLIISAIGLGLFALIGFLERVLMPWKNRGEGESK